MPADQGQRDEGHGLGEADEAEGERVAREQVQLVAERNLLREQCERQQEDRADETAELREPQRGIGRGVSGGRCSESHRRIVSEARPGRG